MQTAAKLIASTETAEPETTPAAAKGGMPAQATAHNNRSPQAEAQRRKWGVETRAVRSIHARKF